MVPRNIRVYQCVRGDEKCHRFETEIISLINTGAE